MRRNVFLSCVLASLLAVSGCAVSQTGKLDNAGSQQGTIKLGVLMPLTGGSARHGEWIRNGVALAIKEVNAAGGIAGKKVEAIYEDTICQPKIGVSAANKLINFDGVKGLIGPWCSSVSLAVAPVAEQAKVPMISGSANDKIKEAGDYVFRLNPGAAREVSDVIGFVRRDLGASKLAILYSNNDYGFAFTKSTEQVFTNLGGKVVLVAAYEQGAKDYRTHLLQVKQAGADAIYMIGYQDEYSQLLRQAREMEMKQQFISTLTFESQDILDTAGEATEGVIYSYLYDRDDKRPVVSAYRQAHLAAYGVESEMWAAMFYDITKIMAQAIAAGGVYGTSGTSIKDELYKVKNFDGVTGNLSFDEYGEVMNAFMVKQVKEGKFVRVK